MQLLAGAHTVTVTPVAKARRTAGRLDVRGRSAMEHRRIRWDSTTLRQHHTYSREPLDCGKVCNTVLRCDVLVAIRVNAGNYNRVGAVELFRQLAVLRHKPLWR